MAHDDDQQIHTVKMSAKQARLLYFCMMKSGLGNTENPDAKDIQEKLAAIADLP